MFPPRHNIGAVRRRWLLAAFVSVAGGLNLFATSEATPVGLSFEPPAVANGLEPYFQELYVNASDLTPSVHAPTAIINADGDLYSYWYGGSREGAKDVAIYGARYDARTRQWQDHRQVVTRERAARETGSFIRKLGNAVAFTCPDGRIWLFYVNVSIGGWAFSAINLAVSEDGGRTFGQHRRLVTSPFLNRSTLVKNAPLLLEDGTVGLPVYHQMASKHGELLRLDDEGNVIGKNRMTAGYPALQPSVISLNDRSDALVAFLRNGSDDDASKMLRTTSNDGGLNWTSMTESNVFNPNSAVSATQSENGMLLVFNNHPHNRDVLSLAYSEDEGHNWQEIYVLESEPNAHKADHTNEFSYPWIVSTPDGIYHLFYTWQRSRIKHVTFNDTWLKAQL